MPSNFTVGVAVKLEGIGCLGVQGQLIICLLYTSGMAVSARGASILNEEEERGYLFLLGDAEGAVLEGRYKAAVLPLAVTKTKADYDFQAAGDTVLCTVTLPVEGTCLLYTSIFILFLIPAMLFLMIIGDSVLNYVAQFLPITVEFISFWTKARFLSIDVYKRQGFHKILHLFPSDFFR